jgi:hypothetical protein
MLWADTANDLLKQRNAADSAWVDILTLSTGAVSNAEVADNAITLAKMAHGTDGEIITYDASGAPATVGVGSSGQVLTSNGAGSAPTMQDSAAGGKVLQVVQATGGSATYPTTSWTLITGASVTITPSSTSSKIMVIFDIGAYSSNTSTGALSVRIRRGANSIKQDDKYGYSTFSGTASASIHMTYLDSPSTTSATTYELDAHVGSASGWDVNVGTALNVIVMEIGA